MVNFDWPGLLKWSLQYQDTQPSNVQARSKEDLEFLEEAIKVAHGMLPDYHKTCLEAIDLLQSDDPAEKLAALGVIQDCLDCEPELARDLANRPEAVKKVIDCVPNADPLSLEQACLVLSFALGNNPRLQDLVYDFGGMDIILTRIEKMREQVQTKSPENPVSKDEMRLLGRLLGCLSGLVKSNDRIEKAFVAHPQGVTTVLRLLGDIRDHRITAKTASLIQHLIAMQTLSLDENDELLHTVDRSVSRAIFYLPVDGAQQTQSILSLLAVTLCKAISACKVPQTHTAVSERLKCLRNGDADTEEMSQWEAAAGFR
eukprot:Protomagalhaensia_wolfi_Nauph_80__4131@NODE_41_length_4357_cov_53_089162_g33_i0_p2_GENE_NODE_41_length_4357_cov_53_089162_g33_i0NODE_41_length_4357_cov_53_089162_g33_i0_p2_ORF_typecomplete_len315_score51_20SIL1/PF16782_5/3_9e06DUF4704/PF15787_5/0_0022Arm_2/PF04826_13/5_7e02Arm_2/PF04826_13/0_4Cytomega_UL20A/PF05984_12/0_12Fes1/PF08609_10/0_39Fes1/PF08609_10/1_3e04Fes1/PF08609_10/6_8e03_NODE_41_length_4357_cov_53_089162_g33_i014292373